MRFLTTTDLFACERNVEGISDYYRPHPKDGEGNVFSLSVSSHLGGGGGVPTLRSGWWGGGTYSQVWIRGVPTFWVEGVPTLRSGWGSTYLVGGGGYLLSGLDGGGTYLGGGVPT